MAGGEGLAARGQRRSPAVAGGEGGYPEAARAAAAHVFVDDLDTPELRPDDRHHLERVLRLRPGEIVSAADGRGGWRLFAFTGTTAGTSARSSTGTSAGAGVLEVAGDLCHVLTPEPAITVGFAPTKGGDRPEWAVQKLTEVGVDVIVPLQSARSVVRWEGSRADHHIERLNEVARQAAMQSRRLTVPVVERVRSVTELMQPAAAEATPALAEPGGEPPSLARPTILVGPEGGWDQAELACASATVALGVNVLRTETAAVVAGSLLVAIRSGVTRPVRSSGDN